MQGGFPQGSAGAGTVWWTSKAEIIMMANP
jgi:hypothetical protein